MSDKGFFISNLYYNGLRLVLTEGDYRVDADSNGKPVILDSEGNNVIEDPEYKDLIPEDYTKLDFFYNFYVGDDATFTVADGQTFRVEKMASLPTKKGALVTEGSGSIDVGHIYGANWGYDDKVFILESGLNLKADSLVVSGMRDTGRLLIEEAANISINEIEIDDKSTITLAEGANLKSQDSKLFLSDDSTLVLNGKNVIDSEIVGKRYYEPAPNEGSFTIKINGDVTFNNSINSDFGDSTIEIDLSKGANVEFLKSYSQDVKIEYVNGSDSDKEVTIKNHKVLESSTPGDDILESGLIKHAIKGGDFSIFAAENGADYESIDGLKGVDGLLDFIAEGSAEIIGEYSDGHISIITTSKGQLINYYSNITPFDDSSIINDESLDSFEVYSFEVKDGEVVDGIFSAKVKNPDFGNQVITIEDLNDIKEFSALTDSRDVADINADDADVSFFLDGNDQVYVKSGSKEVYLGDGNDVVNLSVNTEDTIVDGGRGNDRFFLWSDTTIDANDKLIGGEGHDTVFFHKSADLGASFADSLDSVERLQFKNDSSIVIDDKILEQAGGELSLRAAQNVGDVDLTVDTSGVDSDGDNKVYVYDSSLKVRLADSVDNVISSEHRGSHIEGGTGNDKVTGGAGKDLIYGGAGEDIIFGGAGNDKFYGGAGNDTVNGEAGNDIVYGGDGIDNLNGGAGEDYVSGGTGKDVVDGGAGKDRLFGGSQDDIFKFSNLADSTKTETDTILDFTKGSDKIDLSALGISFDNLDIEVVDNNTNIYVEDTDFAVTLNGQFDLDSNDFNL